MEAYSDFKPTDPIHVTSFNSHSIKYVADIIQGQFNRIERPVIIKPGLAKDSVQMDKRNEADVHILGWWSPKTALDKGIEKIFDEMKKEYVTAEELKEIEERPKMRVNPVSGDIIEGEN